LEQNTGGGKVTWQFGLFVFSPIPQLCFWFSQASTSTGDGFVQAQSRVVALQEQLTAVEREKLELSARPQQR
jgi:hypothetical protein